MTKPLFVLAFAVSLIPRVLSTATATQPTNPQELKPDPRSAKLEMFFHRHKCPDINYQLIPDYLESADTNHIPYTLLPSISLQESSCIQHYRLFNPFGWNSARTGFGSFAEGIRFVSKQLAEGKYYAGKTIDQKLRAFNPNPQYAPKIKQLLRLRNLWAVLGFSEVVG